MRLTPKQKELIKSLQNSKTYRLTAFANILGKKRRYELTLWTSKDFTITYPHIQTVESLLKRGFLYYGNGLDIYLDNEVLK